VLRRFFLIICFAVYWILFVAFLTSANAYEFPPYQALSLKISGQVVESYSNNITYASKNEDRVEDLLTNLAFTAGLKYEGARNTVELNGFLNRQMITEKGTIENSSERVDAVLRNDFSKYDHITVSNTYVHTQVPGTIDEGLNREQCEKLIDIFGRDQVVKLYPECNKFEEEFGRVTGKLDSYVNTANLTYVRDITERFNITAGYIFSQRWSPEKGTTESDRNILRFSTNYGLSAVTIFSLAYSYENARFDSGTDINATRVSAGIRQYITERLYVECKAGMDFSSTHNDSIDIHASLSGEIDKRTSARIVYSRSANISSDTEDVFRNWQVSGSVSRALLEDLNGSLSFFYGQGDYVSADITDTFVGASFDISYNFWKDKLGKSVNGRMGYSYSNLDSTDVERNYSRFGANAGLSVSF
jgi:hypothetical protein